MSKRKDVEVTQGVSAIFGDDTEELFLLRRLAKELRSATKNDASIDSALDTLAEVEKVQRKRGRKH